MKYCITITLIFVDAAAKRAPKNFRLAFTELPIPSLYAKLPMYEIECLSIVNTKQGEDENDFIFCFVMRCYPYYALRMTK